jgi:hypothetical protein
MLDCDVKVMLFLQTTICCCSTPNCNGKDFDIGLKSTLPSFYSSMAQLLTPMALLTVLCVVTVFLL